MPDYHSNFGFSTVLTAPSPASSGTSVVLAAGTGSRFPDPATYGPYNVVIYPVDALPTPSNAEVVRVTAKSTDTLTITREQESSSARTVLVGDNVAMAVTAKTLQDIEQMSWTNEVRNFPSLEGADDTQPMWWTESDGNCTLTEVDLSGESITELSDRALKAVIASAASGFYQRFTYADEPRLKSGRTVSAAVAVWSVSSISVSMSLVTSVGTLGTSFSTTAAAWTILKVENVTLDGTRVDLTLTSGGTGTFYVVPLGLVLGKMAPQHQMSPRPVIRRWKDTAAEVKVLDSLGDEAAWTDVDVTSSTSNLAIRAICVAHMNDAGTAADAYSLHVRRNGSSESQADANMVSHLLMVATTGAVLSSFEVILDDGQIFEYFFDRVAGSGTLSAGEISLRGWDEWG